MLNYRERLMAKMYPPNTFPWPRFRAAPLEALRQEIVRWRALLAPDDQRSPTLDKQRRSLPDCLDNVGRAAARVLDQRPDLAQHAGRDGDAVRDLIDRRGDMAKVAAAAAQIGRAADLALRDGAVALAENNRRALAGLVAAYRDPATPDEERDRVAQWLLEVNDLVEATSQRSARRRQPPPGRATNGASETTAAGRGGPRARQPAARKQR